MKVSKEILVSEGDIEELASIKEVERNETVSLSEKYLIECSKEKITGKRSRVSNQERFTFNSEQIIILFAFV